MSKTLRKIIILFLVLTMLFSASALTIGAVAAENDASFPSFFGEGGGSTEDDEEPSGEGEGQGGSVTTGWCDVTYDTETNEITVTLTPDKDALLGTNRAELLEILTVLGDAIKEVALGDILEDFGGMDIIEGGLDADNVWEKALDAYLNNNYDDIGDLNADGSAADDRKMEFIKDALDSDTGTARVEDFADFVCSLVRAAVLVKPEIRESLPDRDGIDEYVENVLNTLLHNTIDGYIETTVRDYISYLKGEKEATELTGTIEGYMHSLVEDTVDKYLENLAAPGTHSEDGLYKYLSNYVDKYIEDEADVAIQAYIEAKLNGGTIEDSFVNGIIEDYVDSYISARINAYVINKINGIIPDEGTADALFKPYIDEFAKDYVTARVNDYIAAKEDGTEAPNDSLNAMIQTEIDGFISDFVEEKFEAYKAYKLNPVGATPDFYDLIEAKVRTEVINHIVAEGGGSIDVTTATDMYDNRQIEPDEYLTYINEEDVKSYAKTNLTASDYQTAFDSLDIDEVITTVFTDLDSSKLETILSGIDYDGVITSVGSDNLQTIIDGIDVAGAAQNAIASLTATQRKELVEEMYAQLTDDDIAEMIREAIADFTPTDIDNLVGELVISVDEKLKAGDFDELLATHLGIDIAYNDIENQMSNIAHIVGEKYSSTMLELDQIESTPQRIKAILDLVTDMRIDIDEDGVLESEEAMLITGNNGIGIDFQKLIDIVNSLPTIDEIAEMSEDEMQLRYKMGIETVFGDNSVRDTMDTEFTITVKLGDGSNTVNKLFKVISNYLQIIYDENTGMISNINVKIPDEFANLVLKLCNSGRVPDEVKKAIFDKIVETPDDAHAFIVDFTIEDIIKVIDYVDSAADLDGIITEQLVSRFENLDGLSVEKIKEKIEEYENYYFKLIKLFSNAYDYIKFIGLGSELQNGILALHKGQSEYGAVFEFSEDTELDLVDIVYDAISKKNPDKAEDAALLIEAFFYNVTIDIDLTVNLQIANMAKVLYVVDGDVVSAGFLPIGADVRFFAPILSYEGNPIIGWKDASGTMHETMPELDYVNGEHELRLYPAFAEIGDAYITIVDRATGEMKNSKVYDGSPLVLTASVYGANNPATEYKWYKDDILISGATTNVLNLYGVLDSGTYRCQITINTPGGVQVKNDYVTVNISPRFIQASDLTEGWNGGSFTYGDPDISVSFDESVISKYNGILRLDRVYGDLTATEAGIYTAYAEFTILSSDYAYQSDPGSRSYYTLGDVITVPYEWTVAKKQYGDEIVSFIRESRSGNVYMYGQHHRILAQINDPVAAQIFAIDKIGGDFIKTDAGRYTATASVKFIKPAYANNYEWIGSDRVTYSWEIIKQSIDLSDSETYPWQAYSVTADTIDYVNTFDFIYDGFEKGLSVKGLPKDIAQLIKYSGDKSTDAGNFVATVLGFDETHASYALVMNNYDFALDADGAVKLPLPQSWKINKKTLDFSDVKWPEVDENGEYHIEYDGEEHKITLEGFLASAKYVQYKYYVYNTESGEWDRIQAPVDAGLYKVTVSIRPGDTENYEIPQAYTSEFEYFIDKKVIDVDLKLNADEFTYSGNLNSVEVLYGTLLDYYDMLSVIVDEDLSVFSAIDAGEYKVKVFVEIDSQYHKNYSFENGLTAVEIELSWVINKLQLEIPTPIITPSSYVYDGTEKTVEVMLPKSDRFDYNALLDIDLIADTTVLAATNAGTYYVNYVLSLKDNEDIARNYSFTTVMGTVSWTIHKARIDVSSIKWNYTTPFVYEEGTEHEIMLEGLDSALVNIAHIENNVAGALGNYVATAVIELLDPANYEFNGSEEIREDGRIEFSCVWRIVSDYIKLGTITWKPVSYTYDGTEKTIYPTLNLPASSKYNINYSGDLSATNAGTYVVDVEIIPTDSDVYLEYDLAAHSCEWTIEQAVYNMSGVSFEDKIVKYNGRPHSITINGNLPEGVKVDYIGNGQIGKEGEKTVYKVVASFAGDSVNYKPIENMKAYLIVLTEDDPYFDDPNVPGGAPQDPTDPGFDDILDPDRPLVPEPTIKNEFVFGEDGIIKIEAANGISDEYQINVLDKTATYKDLDLTGIYGMDKIATLAVAYDIYFVKDGLQSSVTDNFTVRILIPEDLRGEGKKLGIIHIKDDGTIEPIDESLITREGDYLVFTTTHFSVYAVVEITDVPSEPVVPPTDPGDDAKGLSLLTIILIAILAIFFLFIIFIIVRKVKIKRRANGKTRRKKKKSRFDLENERISTNGIAAFGAVGVQTSDTNVKNTPQNRFVPPYAIPYNTENVSSRAQSENTSEPNSIWTQEHRFEPANEEGYDESFDKLRNSADALLSSDNKYVKPVSDKESEDSSKTRWMPPPKYQPEDPSMVDDEEFEDLNPSRKTTVVAAAIPAKASQPQSYEDVFGYKDPASGLNDSANSLLRTSAQAKPKYETRWMPDVGSTDEDSAFEEPVSSLENSANAMFAPGEDNIPEPVADNSENDFEEMRSYSSPGRVVRNVMPLTSRTTAKAKPVINMIPMDEDLDAELDEEFEYDNEYDSAAEYDSQYDSEFAPESEFEPEYDSDFAPESEFEPEYDSEFADESEPESEFENESEYDSESQSEFDYDSEDSEPEFEPEIEDEIDSDYDSEFTDEFEDGYEENSEPEFESEEEQETEQYTDSDDDIDEVSEENDAETAEAAEEEPETVDSSVSIEQNTADPGAPVRVVLHVAKAKIKLVNPNESSQNNSNN